MDGPSGDAAGGADAGQAGHPAADGPYSFEPKWDRFRTIIFRAEFGPGLLAGFRVVSPGPEMQVHPAALHLHLVVISGRARR